MAKKNQKRGRGRPVKYSGNLARHIVALTKRHGLSGTVEILNADSGSGLASERSTNLVPNPLGISKPTVAKLAHNSGVTFKRGRPAA